MADKGKKQNTQEEGGVFSELAQRFKSNPLIFIGTVFILVLVIVAFVFVPAIAPEAGGGSSAIVFGSYDGVPINYVPRNYLARQYEDGARQYEAFLQQYQGLITPPDQNEMHKMLWQQAFQKTVVHTAILRELEHAGYAPPESVVDKRMAELPQFQENGRFSLVLYNQLSKTDRMNLWKEIHDATIEERFVSDFFLGLNPSRAEIDFFKSMASPLRSFQMAAFSINDYPAAERVKFIEENPDSFLVTQLSKITLTSSEREAGEVLASIQAGTLSFEDAVTTHSQDGLAEQGGRMGQKMAYELAAEIPGEAERKAVVNLGRGELSPVIKVPAGWAVFRSEEKAVPLDTNDSALIDKVKAHIIRNERGRVDDWFLAQAEKLIAQAKVDGFAAAAEAQGIGSVKFGPLPLNYGDTTAFGDKYALSSFNISELFPAAGSEQFWTVAFSTPLNTPSNPIVLGDSIIVLYPDSESQAEEADLTSIENFSLQYSFQTHKNEDLGNMILTSPKFENRFDDMYHRLFYSN